MCLLEEAHCEMHVDIDTALSVSLHCVLKQVVFLWFPRKVGQKRSQKCPIDPGCQFIPGDINRRWQTARLATTGCQSGSFRHPMKGAFWQVGPHKRLSSRLFSWRKPGKMKSDLATLFHIDLSTSRKCQWSINFTALMRLMLYLGN